MSEKKQISEKEQVLQNLDVLKLRVAGLLGQNTPIRDLLFQRLNARLGTLGVNSQQNQQATEQKTPQQMIRCPQCGQDLPIGVAFCFRCGFPVQEQARKEKELEKMSHISVEE